MTLKKMFLHILLFIFPALAYSQEGSAVTQGCVSEGIPENPCALPPLIFTTNITLSSTNCGDQFVEAQFHATPRVQWSGAQDGVNYTFIFIGAIETIPFLHWAVSSIPGSALRGDGDITVYDQLCSYLPPLPFFGRSHPFSYWPLIYRQTSSEPTVQIMWSERIYFDLQRFVQEKGMCGPLAALSARVAQPYP